ncbi:MAG: ATP-binding cassette domain-containing protein, partial [Bradymonadaceae bacterium]
LSEPEEPQRLGEHGVDVVLEGVTFHYHDLETGKRFCALDKVSLKIAVGARVALLGPSGSGKSTTGKLLARLFDPEEGVITMGDVPLPELSLDDLRGRIGYVGQEVFLFNGTIEENIRFGAPGEINEDDIRRVVELAKVDEILEHKELGLMTPVGEKGARLSGGQKKRIALARALLRNPSILIIDQLASDLEEDLNRSIFEGIRDTLDLSILYLGHRIPAGFEADAVYWMEYGRLEKRQVGKEIA